MSQQEELNYCDNCNIEMNQDDHVHIINDMFDWCCNCFHKKYFDCDNCGIETLKTKMQFFDDMDICKKCYKELNKEYDQNV